MIFLPWIRRYRIRAFLANSLWVIPVVGMLLGLVQVRASVWLDEELGWQSDIVVDSARAALPVLASSMLTLIVFVCTSLLVAVQLASAQLTPRIISLVYRDLGTRFSLGVFCFAFAFTLGLVSRVDDSVPVFSATIAAYGTIFSVVVFFYLVDRLGRTLRPVGALREVGRIGQQVIVQVYPRRLLGPESAAAGPERDSAAVRSELSRIVDRASAVTVTGAREGTMLAFDLRGLAALAARHDCVIELVSQTGDFVSRDEPLFRVYGARVPPRPEVLRAMVAIGMERTFEQDPSYALRIMVDMASKALSPAINDPTTAVLAIDQIHRQLRMVGLRRLDEGVVRDGSGRLRFIYWTRDWEDFVRLAVTEIRQFGCESIQVTRRLRAMLDDLIGALPEERTPLLRRELASLDRSTKRRFEDPEDRALAGEGDLQGVGGVRHEKSPVADPSAP